MCLIAPPRHGGAISTRSFIPHRVHKSIGVLGAVSVATACVVPGSVAADMARATQASGLSRFDVEHPAGFFTVEIEIELQGGLPRVKRSALLRTARKLMTGEVYVADDTGGGS
jgi:4-oxalomesaconate tautomerase